MTAASPAESDPVLVSGGRRRARSEIRARAARAARGFSALAIGEGDAVALCLRNDFAFFEASLAAALAGASPVPINWHATAEEAGYILRDCAAKALVIHADLVGQVLPALPPGLPILVVETPVEIRLAYPMLPDAGWPDGAEAWEPWADRHSPLADSASAARSAVIYTSGSTGQPKGVRRFADPQSGNPSPQPSARALAVYGFDRPGPATVLINGPMYHSVPNAYGRLALQAGVAIVLQARFDPEEMLSLIARYRVTHLHGVPAMFVRLLRLPEAVRARHDLSSLLHVVHGAAPCPPATKAAMIAWWGPVIHEYYGSTETGLLTLHDSAEALERPGTVGRALPGIDLAILDPDGTPVPTGAIGEVHAGSANLHRFTYVGLDERRADIARGDLVATGDLGRLDSDGYLFLSDRKRDVVVAGGIAIYPAEIEATLLGLPGVKDCAVFGIPDAERGEAVCACVEAITGVALDPADLGARLAATLDPSKLPSRIDVIAGLPREDSGKIFKDRLRALYRAPG